MQKPVLICIALLFGCLLSVDISAQSNTRYFHHYSTEDGLPQSSINAIVQDQRGFMWFGTQDGLARYDGYTFRIFRNDIADSTTLCNNFIHALMASNDGRIWIGTRNGLSIYHPKTDKFTSFFSAENDSASLNSSLIMSIFQDSRGEIYVGTNSGLNKAIPGKNYSDITFQRYRSNFKPGQNEVFEGTVHDITEDRWGHIWFASQGKDPETREDNGALTCYDSNRNTFTHYYSDSAPNGLSSNAVRSLYTRDNTLWVGTIDGGLNKILLRGDCEISEIQVINSGTNPNNLPHEYVSKIIADKRSDIWVGTYEGLVSTNPALIHFKNDNEFEHLTSTSPPIINDLLSDNADNIWVGTDKGLYAYFPSYQPFKIYKHDPNDPNSLAAGDIFGIHEDSIGDLWAVSYGTGLNRIINTRNRKERIIRYTDDDKIAGLPTTQLLGITEDNEQNLWLASFDGLIKISKQNQSEEIYIKHYSPEELITDGSPRKYYTRIFSHTNGSLWVRTYQNGIDEITITGENLDIKNHTEIFVENVPQKIRSFFMDHAGSLWIVTDSSLLKANIDDEGNLTSTPVTLLEVPWEKVLELDINYIQKNEDNYIWLGTSNGLVKITLQEDFEYRTSTNLLGKIKIYTENDGLPNNTVYGIASDDNSNLWLSTNKGLSKFSIPDETFTNYLLDGGATINEFNEGAVAKGRNGRIYFGGIGGLVGFHPDSIQQNPFIPPVVITEFRVSNITVPPGDERLHFSEISNTLEEITLSYTDDFFTIQFAALNFNQPERNLYAYKLHGFHDEWVNIGNNRQATFTNLDDGEYIFQVIGSNNDGIWNQEGASLRIIILPPFWETWYAYAFYVFIFFLSVYLFIRQRIRAATKEMEIKSQIERAKHNERERFRKKTSQDFHDEAGNKITKINLFTELAKAEAGNSMELNNFLRKIESNTRELSAGMRDFIWTLDPEKDTLFDTLMRLKDFGNSMFQDSGATFIMEGLSSRYHHIKLPMDMRRTILLIFKEAMNNCAKYANASKVVLKILVKGDLIEIIVKDNGIGFDPAEAIHQKGYGTKIMRERAEKIGGKLTIDSKKGGGTEIGLTCNLPHIGDIE